MHKERYEKMLRGVLLQSFKKDNVNNYLFWEKTWSETMREQQIREIPKFIRLRCGEINLKQFGAFCSFPHGGCR